MCSIFSISHSNWHFYCWNRDAIAKFQRKITVHLTWTNNKKKKSLSLKIFLVDLKVTKTMAVNVCSYKKAVNSNWGFWHKVFLEKIVEELQKLIPINVKKTESFLKMVLLFFITKQVWILEAATLCAKLCFSIGRL